MLLQNTLKSAALLLLLLLTYLLAVYPVIQEIQNYQLEEHSELLQNCPCGCGSIEGQCCCEEASAVIGLQQCSSKADTVFPFTPLWNFNTFPQNFAYVDYPQENLPCLAIPAPRLQDIFTLIDHPPPPLFS